MAFCKQGLGPVPDDTARLLRRTNKSHKLYIQIEEIIMEVFAESDLSPFFAKRGQWGIHPIRVCSILLLQAMENLTDRQVEHAINLNNGWKYVLHMGQADDAWDPSVLCEHRNRFDHEEALKVFLDAILSKARDKGLLDTRMQRMDSTFVVANVRLLQRAELILETVRNAIEEITEVDMEWMSGIRLSHWLQTYYLDRPFNYKLPKEETKRTKIAESSATDGFYILDQIEGAEPAIKGVLSELESVKILKRVLDEQTNFEGKGKGRKIKLKEQGELPPSGERLVSPHETDARAASKGGKTSIGYRTHTMETCTPGFPRLITHIRTEIATLNDSLSLEPIIRSVQKRKFLPKRLWIDGGYVNVQIFAQLAKSFGIDFVARLVNGMSWQSIEGKGFDLPNFSIDFRREIATCPAKAKSATWKNDGTGGANVYFSAKDCGPCPFKKNCTKADFRVLHLKSKPVYRYMGKMRARQDTDEFQKEYSVRAGAESLQANLIKLHGRRTTVRTKSKVSLKLVLAAAAMNILRIIDWTNKQKRKPVRKSHYERAFGAA